MVCVPLTSNLICAGAPGNTLLPARATGLPKDSVANASVGRLASRPLARILHGIDVVLGR